MKRFFSLFAISFIAVTSSGSAAVIERDWKTPGDGLLTYDTINKREWVDLSQTILDDRFPGTGADFLEVRESRYQYVAGQTAPGGLFEGFTIAKSADVIALAQSAAIDTSTDDYVTNVDATLAVSELLSFTFDSLPGAGAEATGLLDEIGNIPFEHRAGAKFEIGVGHQAGLRLGSVHLQNLFFPPGVMLYRAIPEPCGSTLLFLAGAGLSCSMRSFRCSVA